MPIHQRMCTLIAVLDHQGPFQLFYIYIYTNPHISTTWFSPIMLNIQADQECHRLLALSQRIFDMECHSSSIVVLDSCSQSPCSQQCHWTCLQCLLLYYIHVPTMPAVWGSFILVTSWPHLMQPLKANSHWKMMDMRVAARIWTYQPLSDVLPGSSMFPVMATSPLTPPRHAAPVPASHITNLYDASYHLVPLMMKKTLQLTLHPLTALCHHSTPWVLHNSHIPNASLQYMMTYEKTKKKKRIFKQFH